MVKEYVVTPVAALITFLAARFFARKEKKINLQQKLLVMYEELSAKHIELQEKYNTLAQQNMQLQNKLTELDKELKCIKAENHYLKIKVSILQRINEEYYEKNTTSANNIAE